MLAVTLVMVMALGTKILAMVMTSALSRSRGGGGPEYVYVKELVWACASRQKLSNVIPHKNAKTLCVRSSMEMPSSTIWDRRSVHRCEAYRHHLAADLACVEPEGAADRRPVDIDHHGVHPQISCVPRVVITARDEFLRMSVIAEDVGGPREQLESLGYNHVRQLNVESVIAH